MFPSRALTAVAAVALALTACKKEPAEAPRGAAAEVILLGHVGSMTGNEATFGDSSDKAIRLAIDEVNAAGGVKGRKLEVKTYDDQGKPEEASVAATRLIVQDKVAVLLGEVASSRSLAMAPIADAKGVPMVSPSSTNPKVTVDDEGKVRPFVFRVCFIDPFQGFVMAKFAKETLKAKSVAVLKDNKADYSLGLSQFFVDEFKKGGGEIVAEEAYSQGDTDFRGQLTAIKGKRPEAIYVPGYYNDVGVVARQARELGIKAPLLGGDGWESEKLYELGGPDIDGSYYTNHYSAEDPSPRIQDFIKRYKEKFNGAMPDSLAALGYDSAMVAIQAMARARDLSGPAIRDEIKNTKDHPGIAGTITLNDKRDAVKPAVVLQVQGKTSKYVATVTP
jgi:branched-chain amino acid transport system substrate-binding protein